jgi:hypothetical protein
MHINQFCFCIGNVSLFSGPKIKRGISFVWLSPFVFTAAFNELIERFFNSLMLVCHIYLTVVGFVLRPAWAGAPRHGIFPSARSPRLGSRVSLAFPRLARRKKAFLIPPHVLLTQNLSAFAESSSFTSFIRRGRDSNPRYVLKTY